MNGLLAILLAAAAAAAAGGAAPPLLPVPAPDPARMEAAVREQVEAAEKAVAAAPAQPPAAASEAFGSAGRVYLLYDLLDAALPCFENARALAPADYRWPYYLGVLDQARGDFAGAAAAFEEVLRLKPDDLPALLRLGEVELLRQRTDEAAKSFAAALRLAPSSAAAHYGLGRTAMAKQDFAAAVGELQAALAGQPAATVIHYSLGMAYRRLGQLDRAAAELAGFRDVGPGGGGAVKFPDPLVDQLAGLNAGAKRHVALATSALQQGRFALAAEEYRKALAGDPTDTTAWLNLGAALERLSDPAGAEEAYRRAVALAPKSSQARYNLGTLLASRGKRQEGIEQLEAAVTLDSAAKDARFNLATALVEAGSFERALGQYDRLLELDARDSAHLPFLERGYRRSRSSVRRCRASVWVMMTAMGVVGDATSLEELYRVHYRSLVKLASLLVDDVGTCEEVVQDAFVAVHRLRPDDASKLPAYLRSAVLNGARSHLRRQAVRRRERPVWSVMTSTSAEAVPCSETTSGPCWRLCGPCPPVSAPCSCCATGSICPRARSPRRWVSPPGP